MWPENCFGTSSEVTDTQAHGKTFWGDPKHGEDSCKLCGECLICGLDLYTVCQNHLHNAFIMNVLYFSLFWSTVLCAFLSLSGYQNEGWSLFHDPVVYLMIMLSISLNMGIKITSGDTSWQSGSRIGLMQFILDELYSAGIFKFMLGYES